MRIQDEAPLTVVSIVRGHAWVIPENGEPERLAAGDVAVLRGPRPYAFADHPETPWNVIIHPGQICTTVSGEDLAERMDLGIRTWGNDLNGSTVMLTGTYEMHSAVGDRLLRSLPDLVVLRDGTADLPVIDLLNQEIGKEEPGQEAVLDRLLDLLVIAVLRAWFSRPEADVPAWYRAYSDPVVGPAIRMLQNDPSRQWTVALLADAVGVSRATLARRFTELVGVPPDDLSHRLADCCCSRSAATPEHHDRSGRQPSGLREPVCVEHGVQTAPGCEPCTVPTAGCQLDRRFSSRLRLSVPDVRPPSDLDLAA